MTKQVLSLLIAVLIMPGTWLRDGLPSAPSSLANTSQSQEVLIEGVLIRGNRRIPEPTIKIWIGTREGDPYNPIKLDRDVRALNAQGHFDDVKVFAEEGSRGGKIITFELRERPLLLDIKYEGLKSIQQSTLLEEFRKRQVGLSKESQYDPVKAKRAAAVIKEMLANEGRPEAKVDPAVEEISATAVALTFKIDEGPRFRVADVEFEGNTVYSDSDLRSKMKLVKKVGLFTTFSSKDIYHKEKLQADLDRLRVLVYADNGYLKARFGEPRVEEVGKVGTWVPLVGHKGRGLKIVIPIDEGRQYKAGEVRVEDNTEFTADQIKAILDIKAGDVVRGYSVVNKGIENLKKLYGSRGYIQFEAGYVPDFKDTAGDTTTGIVDITFSMEEGKQYMLRRLEFIGNTFTRDNVLRREVLLNEGERYNEEYWDLSLLRLNQLGYFEQVKKEDATVNTNEKEGQVDVTLKVQEKGRQQVSFNGGTSGSQGSFFGIDYSTQNLLGYGESLSFGVSAGNQQTSLSFGFSEPYLKGRPISLGFNLFYYNYQFVGQGFGSTQTADDLYNSYGGQSLFSQKTRGASVTLSAPLSYFARRFRMGRFIRLGVQYTYSTTDIEDPAVNRDEDTSNDIIVTFRQSGVKQSTITPTISYNTLNSSLDPTSGQSLTLGASLSGGVLGGAVNTIAPIVEFKLFRPLFAGREATARPDPGRTRTFGMRALFGHTSAYGGRFDSNSASFIGGAPLSSRFYLGGEDSIRGYNVRSIAPLIPVERTVNTRNVYVTDLDGNRLKVRDRDRATSNSVAPSVIALFTQNNVSVSDTSYVPVGSDTQLLLNFEYRIPLVGPVTFAPFLDVGSTFNLRKLEDQFIYSEYVTTNLNSGLTLILNPIGILATERQLRNSGLPESAGAVLPPGFRYVNVYGEQQTNTKLGLSQSLGGLFENYRYSLGGELRVQVPVINVPFRLIFAWNPNARVNNAYVFEEKRAIRFSIGRTF